MPEIFTEDPFYVLSLLPKFGKKRSLSLSLPSPPPIFKPNFSPKILDGEESNLNSTPARLFFRCVFSHPSPLSLFLTSELISASGLLEVIGPKFAEPLQMYEGNGSLPDPLVYSSPFETLYMAMAAVRGSFLSAGPKHAPSLFSPFFVLSC